MLLLFVLCLHYLGHAQSQPQQGMYRVFPQRLRYYCETHYCTHSHHRQTVSALVLLQTATLCNGPLPPVRYKASLIDTCPLLLTQCRNLLPSTLGSSRQNAYFHMPTNTPHYRHKCQSIQPNISSNYIVACSMLGPVAVDSEHRNAGEHLCSVARCRRERSVKSTEILY